MVSGGKQLAMLLSILQYTGHFLTTKLPSQIVDSPKIEKCFRGERSQIIDRETKFEIVFVKHTSFCSFVIYCKKL